MPDDDAQEMPAWLSEMRQRELDQFQVGDEVVVALGECEIGKIHGDRELGLRGMVVATDGGHFTNPHPVTHPIWVSFRGGWSWFYAPGELRPFDIMAEIQRIALTSESPPRDGE